ncbi:hypothetical protein [Bordetella pseudohinzii]|uniref:Helix-turn-helix domain-containing protein n=1 Tax=Bordetella pseudohinzii TaxID=1331258 RepID=A0A0J6EYD7_9BORD|nr:hypothetical protein [Bordetella pseudohinzii]ANY16152.1 hypothetical protein BBN53_09735 [Bordetella pseudohinzii]KMM25360.1 hypothetical protein L540_21050 [Bordetella pseudohinzii]KXA76540.1 hypothetical protein AW878_17675 [Bordetella pseudohinzii]KXA81250.1 hypothetical protein AW877_04800 [Bordetella pseudohinzii]CUJ04124.1 Uncharacterised protein [Bordetella pseudohinzii]
MDAELAAAWRALARGDALGALNLAARREDAPGLAVRGVVMARIGDFDRARALLARAAAGFGVREPRSRARCQLALAEIALARRELRGIDAALARARAALRGDRHNTAYAVYLQARSRLLAGHVGQARALLEQADPHDLLPRLRPAWDLLLAGIHMRDLDARAARQALARARAGVVEAGLQAEIARAEALCEGPAAVLADAAGPRVLDLDGVQALFESGRLVVDGCRHGLRAGGLRVDLRRRPVLLALARELAQAWPADVDRESLARRVFRARRIDETHRARLRVEMGRLRQKMAPLAGVQATAGGYRLLPLGAAGVAVLLPPATRAHPAIAALLADGQAWSAAALAQVLGLSARTVQRGLRALAEADQAQAMGQGRARRWTGPLLPGFPTDLLLPVHEPPA